MQFLNYRNAQLEGPSVALDSVNQVQDTIKLLDRVRRLPFRPFVFISD